MSEIKLSPNSGKPYLCQASLKTNYQVLYVPDNAGNKSSQHDQAIWETHKSE